MAISQPRSRNLVASRRRRVGDEGDEEEHELDSIDDDSHSDTSATTGLAEEGHRPHPKQKAPPNGVVQKDSHAGTSQASSWNSQAAAPFTPIADTAAIMDGLEIPPGNHDEDIMEFDDDEIEEWVPPAAGPADEAGVVAEPAKSIEVLDTAPQNVNPKQASAQPLNNRKGHAARPSQSQPSRTANRWHHDLHDSVREPGQTFRAPPKPAQQQKGPILSTTLVVGLVTMRVALPRMREPIVYEKMPVKHHVRLPDLRPPLRRDKPVRIAIEDNPPRYIFPSIERSFIFIPRAQRPNQQNARHRNRPYFSQFSSRRGSVYGGSNQGASGAVSRRSSIAREALISPTESVISRAPAGAPTGPASRPVVRLPNGNRPSSNISLPPMTGAASHYPLAMPYPLPSRPALRENREGPIPMHQPKPQKTLSLNSLEVTGSDQLQAPPQQEQQPFHHQFPMGAGGAEAYGPAAGQPSMLPEQAINAQPFQPGQPVFYPQSYPMHSPYYYYPASADGQMMTFGSGPAMAGYAMYPTPSNYMMPMGALSGTTNDASAYSQESNGTIFYYPPGPAPARSQGEHLQEGPTGYAPGAGQYGSMKPEAGEYNYQPSAVMYYPTQA